MSTSKMYWNNILCYQTYNYRERKKINKYHTKDEI